MDSTSVPTPPNPQEPTPEQWMVLGPVIVAQRQRLHARVMELEAQLMDLSANMALRDSQLSTEREKIRRLEEALVSARTKSQRRADV